MRTMTAMVVGAGIVIGMTMSVPPAAAERVCGPPECHTPECWWVGPGHRRCRRECRRRCYWQPEPRYEQPRYVVPQPTYVPAIPFQVPPDFPVEAVAGGVVLIIILAIVGLFSQPSINKEIAEAEEAALSARAEAQDIERQAVDMDRHTHAAEQDAYQRGRRAADREWQQKDWTHE